MDISLFICSIIVRRLVNSDKRVIARDRRGSILENQENSSSSIDHDSDRWQPRTQDYAVNQGP